MGDISYKVYIENLNKKFSFLRNLNDPYGFNMWVSV